MAKNNSNNSGCGCGCLVLIVLAIVFVVDKCVEPKSNTTRESGGLSSSVYQNPSTTRNALGNDIEDELSEEDRMYLDNSLATGATPYVDVYGDNYHCPYSQCSGIKVTAPRESDIVVIIKSNNLNGIVVAHGYIKAGGTYKFDLFDGIYQTFFYYGKGWNPNKDMGNDVKGGFVKDEIYSKDNPQELNNCVISYVLQLQRDGNFSTKGSNRGEVF
jgi:hypothetical protein